MAHDVLVVGATGAIGQALVNEAIAQLPADARLIRMARHPERLPQLDIAQVVIDLPCDFSTPALVAADFQLNEQAWSEQTGLINPVTNLAQVWLATGVLHNEQMQPEKRHQAMTADNLQRSFNVNAIGPSLLLSQLFQRLPRATPLKVGVLSARVGSISDNRMGGWYGYRASKAALNMLLKTLAIELAISHPKITLVGMQPGTTVSGLSAPFSRRIDPDSVQTPQFTAQHLYRVLAQCQPSDSGKLVDFMGEFFAP